MLRQGPVPRLVHGLIEYAAGVLFLLAPFVLSFEAGEATAVAIVAGVVVLLVAATTAGPTGLISQIPVPAHVVLDFLLAGLLIAAPFLFGFSDERNPTAFFIAIGVVHLLLTVATRFVAEGEPRRGRARRERAQAPSEPGSA